MADRTRIVTKNGATVATVLDLEVGDTYVKARDTFAFTPPPAQQQYSQSAARFGGGWQTAERHDNASVKAQWLVKGATADGVNQNVEALLAQAQTTPLRDRYFEWRPEGATQSTFWQIRGAASWAPTYSWAQYQGARSMLVEITWPVAPLAEDVPQAAMAFAAQTLPAVLQLPNPVQGTAPALAEIAVTDNESAAFALIAWCARPTAGAVRAPFGIIEAEADVAANRTGWAVTADASARGGSKLGRTVAGLETLTARWEVDPGRLRPDSFRGTEVEIEVWARVRLASTLVSPRLVLAARPAGAPGAVRYSNEFGREGKLLRKPEPTATLWRFTRVGTVVLDTARTATWHLTLDGLTAAGSTGAYDVDYLICALARQRAVSPTGKSIGGAYPLFLDTAVSAVKTIRHDLSGFVRSVGGVDFPDSGLGGSLLELPPGDVDVLVKLSNAVPDEPAGIPGADEQLAYSADVQVTPTPRYHLAR